MLNYRTDWMLKPADNLLNGHSSMFRQRRKKSSIGGLESFKSLSFQTEKKKIKTEKTELKIKLAQVSLTSKSVFWSQNQTLWELDMKHIPLRILFG